MSSQHQPFTGLSAHQPSLWPAEASPRQEAAADHADHMEPEVASPRTRRKRTPSFVCEVPLRVGPAEERALQAHLAAARALYNACLGEARRRWELVKQSRAYQHARTLPRKTPERTAAFQSARAAYGFTDAALQEYAKDCRHASHWIEDHLDAPVSQTQYGPGVSGRTASGGR